MASNRRRRKSLTLNKDKHKKSIQNQTVIKQIKSLEQTQSLENTASSSQNLVESQKTNHLVINEDKENHEKSIPSSKENDTTNHSEKPSKNEKAEKTSYIRKLAATVTDQILNSTIDCPPIYIKSITFHNFKSYKGTHRIPMLDKRFNVIVGPNGSGKSNIIDGIQFIFGYTAKKMRHLTIGNLVNDSAVEENAYVEMELEGEVSNEIQGLDVMEGTQTNKIILKRTVNRSGKSVYLINNNPVSNKIMTNFLSKLGIDTRTNRFLILQGEIESIGLLKPKSDQSFKYAYKPDITDLNTMELEINKIMKEEVEYNSSFGLLEYFEQIIGTLSFNYRIQRLKEISNCLNEKIEAERPTYAYNKSEYEKFEFKLKNQQELLKDYCLFINKLQAIKAFKKKLEEEIKKENSEKISHIQKESEKEKKIIEKENELIKKILNEFNELKEKEIEIKQNIKRGNDFINKIDLTFKDLIKIETEIKRQEEFNEKERIKSEEELISFENLLKEIELKLKEESDTKNKKAENKKNKIKEELKKINNEISNKVNTEKELTNLIKSLKVEEEILLKDNPLNFKGEILNLKDFKRKYKETFRKNISEDSKILPEILNELKDTQAEYQTLKSNINSNSILNLLNIKGVHGRVMDLIKVPKTFKKAFISACRGLLNNIIVDSKEVAQECIKILKKNNKRCTFLVLKDFQQFEAKPLPVTFNSEDINFPSLTSKYNSKTTNSVYPLSSFIHCDSIYYPLLKSFLSTYLCPEYLMKHVAFTRNQRCVNLEGMVIEKSGVMYKHLNSDCQTFTTDCGIRNCHCGNNLNTKSVEERRSLKELEEEILKLESQLACIKEFERHEEDLKNKEAAAENIFRLLRGIDDSLQFSENLLKPENLNISKSDKTTKHVICNTEALKSQLTEELKSQLTEEIKTLKTTADALKEEFTNCQTPYEKQVKEKYEIENKILKTKDKLKKGDLSLTTLKRRETTTRKNLKEEIQDFFQSQKTPFKIFANETNEEKIKKTINEAVKILIHEESEIIDKSETLKTRIKNLKENLTGLFNKQFERETEISKLQKSGLEINSPKIDETCLQNFFRLKQFLKEIKQNEENKQKEGSENENIKVPVKIQILEGKIEELRFLAEKHGTKETHKIISIPSPDFSFLEVANSQMKIFRRFIEDFEEFEAIQRDLIFLIETLKVTRRKLFETEFERIKQKFKFVYRTLTFGGNAEIELVNFLDPFDGLQLSVMPLKKSWTSVRNLSGGEKTLTSLSLLFAIQSSKPSPFYFLDEIDAALDYRNVNVIANFLLFEKAQFVVISLRNDMVEKAKELIGVCKIKTESRIVCLKV